MSSHFGVSVRFLDMAYHGREDGGQPEWPPSPLRLFQALVAAAARLNCGQLLDTKAGEALRWLEALLPPSILAPAFETTTGYFSYLPNNAMDIVARAWCRGVYVLSGDASPAAHRTAKKAIRPTRMRDGDAVHFVWELPRAASTQTTQHVGVLCEIAKSISALGWGIDMAVGFGRVLSSQEVDGLGGNKWVPIPSSQGSGLRVPIGGTLEALVHRYEGFLSRIGPEGFSPPPTLTTFASTEYRLEAQPLPRVTAAFTLLKSDASGFRAFDTCRRGLSVAGMLRHAAKTAATFAGWPEDKIGQFVLGHGEDRKTSHVAVGSKRFAFIPLPTIEYRGNDNGYNVGSIRRVLITTYSDECQGDVVWARRALSGAELLPTGTSEAVALLSLIPTSDRVVAAYTGMATRWTTVTPIILPGFDDPNHARRRLRKGVDDIEQRQLLDRLAVRTEQLIRKAMVQAGLPKVLADHADLEWNQTGYMRGVAPVGRYGVPDHLKKFPRVHVRLSFRDVSGMPVQIGGPICLGGGRYYGLGLLVANRDE